MMYSGRLGLGEDMMGVQLRPVVVNEHIKTFKHKRIASASCGVVHTLVVTECEKYFEGDGVNRCEKVRIKNTRQIHISSGDDDDDCCRFQS